MTHGKTNIISEEYEIIDPIGTGGTADVYLARRLGQARPVVVKLFAPGTSVDLIRREGDIAGKIHFPGFVRVMRTGQTAEGRAFLQLEWCEGTTLEPLAGRLSEAKLLSLLSAISASLFVLHRAGYSHNDVKPANIFCPVGMAAADYPIERLYYVKLSDFSLARRLAGEETDTVTGTVGYMSPEMILKHKIAPASDLFSLGVVAYFLACGRMPFGSSADDPLEINAQITEGERPPLSGPATDFSAATAAVIDDLLSIEPGRRPATAVDLMERLAAAGSPYPADRAVRPKHLMAAAGAGGSISPAAVFGEGSFSPPQEAFIQRATGHDFGVVRLLLEHNFNAGRFTRQGSCWKWCGEGTEAIDWPPRLDRFALRPLRRAPLSLMRLALAMSLLGEQAGVESLTENAIPDYASAVDRWRHIPAERIPSLLHSLERVMSAGSRRILASRLAAPLVSAPAGLVGRLHLMAGHYPDAIRDLSAAAEEALANHTHDEALAWLNLARMAAVKLADPVQEAEIALKIARLCKDLGQMQDAHRLYKEVIDLAESHGPESLLAQACKELGDVYKAMADYHAGIDILRRALDICRRLDDSLGVSHTLNNLGNISWVAGNLDQARDYYLQALEIQTQLQSDKDIASTLNNIGTIYAVQARFDDAIANFKRSLEMTERLGNLAEIARSHNNLGVVSHMAGMTASAADAFQCSLSYNRRIGAQTEVLLNIENLAEAMIQAGRLSSALQYLKEGDDLAGRLGNESHQSTVLQLTGQLLRRMGYYGDAEDKLTKALDLADRKDNRSVQLSCYLNLARLHVSLREYESAAPYMMKAQAAAEALGDKGALFHIALLRLTLTGERQYLAQAERLLGDVHNPREAAYLSLTILEHHNRAGLRDIEGDTLARATEFFSGENEDIEQARFYLAMGRRALLRDEPAMALDQGRKAQSAAVALGLLPEQWQAAALLSDVAFARDDVEGSFRAAQQALEILKRIAAKAKNPQRLAGLYRDASISDLLGRVRTLQAHMGKRKGAAVGSP